MHVQYTYFEASRCSVCLQGQCQGQGQGQTLTSEQEVLAVQQGQSTFFKAASLVVCTQITALYFWATGLACSYKQVRFTYFMAAGLLLACRVWVCSLISEQHD